MEISQLIPIQGERKLFFERSRMFSVIVGFQDPIPLAGILPEGRLNSNALRNRSDRLRGGAAAAVPRLSEIDWRSLRFVINDTPL